MIGDKKLNLIWGLSMVISLSIIPLSLCPSPDPNMFLRQCLL